MASRFLALSRKGTSLGQNLSSLFVVSTKTASSIAVRNFSQISPDEQYVSRTDPTKLRKGEIDPFYAREIRTARDSYYKTHFEELPLISRRHVDDNGLFVRTSPKILSPVPENRGKYHLSPDTMFYNEGDVDLYLYPISQPDNITANAVATEMLFGYLKPDAVVVPLCAPRTEKSPPVMFFHESLPKELFVNDELSLNGPCHTVTETGEYIETYQTVGAMALKSGATIALGGRFENVTYTNYLYKMLYNNQVPGILQRTYEGFCSGVSIFPDPVMPFNTLRKEITGVFENALVFASSVRSTIEEQQELYDQDTNPKKKRRVVFAFTDTAQLRHFENVYDVLPVLSKTDMVYLKYGYAAAFDAITGESFHNMIDPTPLAEQMGLNARMSETFVSLALNQEFMVTFAQKKRNALPWYNIHKLFSQIYGPVASADKTCGQCKFSYDSNGNYKAECRDPAIPLTQRVGELLFNRTSTFTVCGDPSEAYDLRVNPLLMRFPPLPSTSQEKMDEWMQGVQLRDKPRRTVDTKKPKSTIRPRISDFMNRSGAAERLEDANAEKAATEANDKEHVAGEEAAPTASEAAPETASEAASQRVESAEKATAEPVTTAAQESFASAPVAEKEPVDVRDAMNSMYQQAKTHNDNLKLSEDEKRRLRMEANSASAKAAAEEPTHRIVEADVVMEKKDQEEGESNTSGEGLGARYKQAAEAAGMSKEDLAMFQQMMSQMDVSQMPPSIARLYTRIREDKPIYEQDITDAFGITPSEMAELRSLLARRKSGDINMIQFSMKTFPLIKKMLVHVQNSQK